MIKFFRKIRQNLLMENKTGKYLKYAIGEILLVVIGIIIALQLNNWNESRNLKYKEIVILKALKSELENDLNTEIILAKNYYHKKDKALSKLIGVYTKKENISNDSLLNYFRGSLIEWNFGLNVAAFENLKSTGLNLISNDSLRLKISSIYSNHYPEILIRSNYLTQFYEREFRPILYDNLNFINPKLSQSEFDYLKNSKQVSNRIIDLYGRRKWIQEELNIVIPKLESLLRDIDQELVLIEK